MVNGTVYVNIVVFADLLIMKWDQEIFSELIYNCMILCIGLIYF